MDRGAAPDRMHGDRFGAALELDESPRGDVEEMAFWPERLFADEDLVALALQDLLTTKNIALFQGPASPVPICASTASAAQGPIL